MIKFKNTNILKILGSTYFTTLLIHVTWCGLHPPNDPTFLDYLIITLANVKLKLVGILNMESWKWSEIVVPKHFTTGTHFFKQYSYKTHLDLPDF